MEAIPAARHRELAGQTHNVKPAVLAPAVVEFLTGSHIHGVEPDLMSPPTEALPLIPLV